MADARTRRRRRRLNEIPPSRLEVLDEHNQTADAVFLRYIYGDQAQALRVHIARADVTDFQGGLSPRDQDEVVRINLETLQPIIEEKRLSAGAGHWSANPITMSMPIMMLTQDEVRRGLKLRLPEPEPPPVSTWQSGTDILQHPPVNPAGAVPPITFTFPELRVEPDAGVGLRANAVVQASARAELTLTPSTVQIDAATRTDLVRRLNAIEEGLRTIAPVIEALAVALAIPEAERGQIGDNNPPGAIDDTLPIDLADIALGAAAIRSMRIELTAERQRVDVLHFCSLAVGHVAKVVLAFGKWFEARATPFIDGVLTNLQKPTAWIIIYEVTKRLDIGLDDLHKIISLFPH